MMLSNYRIYLILTVILISRTYLQAATWIYTSSNEWLYADVYLATAYFEFSEEVYSEDVVHAISFPISALDSMEYFNTKVIKTDSTIELWGYGRIDSIKIKDLTVEGLLFFEEYSNIRFYKGRKVDFFLKEYPNGEVELWDAYSNERVIGLKKQAVEQFRRKEELLILTLMSDN